MNTSQLPCTDQCCQFICWYFLRSWLFLVEALIVTILALYLGTEAFLRLYTWLIDKGYTKAPQALRAAILRRQPKTNSQ
jgi:hypothetical protein